MTIGTSRGPWRKLKTVGKGSFGSVYLVSRHAANDSKRYVMKEVQLRGLPPKEVAASQNEVEALKRLKHPHIVGYVDTLVVDNTLVRTRDSNPRPLPRTPPVTCLPLQTAKGRAFESPLAVHRNGARRWR